MSRAVANDEPVGRIGRPRLKPRPTSGDPTEEILTAAARLFGELGYGATSMARIASDAGLRQSSLYYYFHSKEDVLAAIVARANVVPLELLDRIEAAGGPASVRLYRFVHGDVLALCALGFDINEVHRQAALDRERFADYWRERRALRRRIAAILRDGAVAGVFREVDYALVALTVMSNDEAVQNWLRVSRELSRDASAAAVAVADLAVGGLLAAPKRLSAVRRDALDSFR
ncbi:MAG: TetR/AcrR family transcriptional regulator [Acidimicrobiia bacterium]